MKILHVQKVKGVGGCERHLLDLLPALASRGHDVRMLVLTTGEWERFAEPLAARGVPVVTAPAGADLDPRTAGAIRRELKAFEPDLVHTHLIHADVHGQAAARLARVPGVITAHNASPLLRRAAYRLAARTAGRAARRTIAISDHVRRYVEGLGIPRRDSVRVVPYGIDPVGWQLTPAGRASARSALGLAETDVAVAIAARLIEGKGHDVLLDAIGMLAGSDRAADPAGSPLRLRLLVAGDGPLRPTLEALAGTLPAGSVRFLGFLDDVHQLIGAADVVAFPTLPSLGEGFGMTALEAMAAGVPVVASDAGALAEVVTHGQTGLVVPGGDAAALAAALGRLAADPAERARLGDAGADRARTDFSLDAMVERTLGVYAEALGDRGSP